MIKKIMLCISLSSASIYGHSEETFISNDQKKESFMIDQQEIREQGVVGKLFLPKEAQQRPAILVFSGSDGGFHARQAELFAKEGYVSLALAFFNAEGLPQNLENIPLEYFLNAVRWLNVHPSVQKGNIHLYGPSKGGELVLLLASTFPDKIRSVVAIVPSCVTFGGIPNEQVSCWTLGEKPLPIAPSPSKEDVYKQLESRNTVDLAQIFIEKMSNEEAFENAFIHVENIECPILLVSGAEDKMWPSSTYSDLIMKRLEKFNSPIFRQHLCYEKAGHMITNPYDSVMTEPFKHPFTGLLYEIGGNPKAQAEACKDSWEKILQFFARWSAEQKPSGI